MNSLHTFLKATSAALIVTVVFLTTGCAAQTTAPLGTPTVPNSESRVAPDQARSESLAIVEKLRRLDVSAVPEPGQPTATECGPHSDEGVKFSWAVEGASPPEPRGYIDRAEAVLNENGYSTHRTTSFLHDGRPLYYLGADRDGASMIGLGASAMNTVLQLSSDCADGTASDFF